MLVSVYNENVDIIERNMGCINMRYIDGSIKNRKFMKGYCNCELHPGALNEKMMGKHQCHAKECMYLYDHVPIDNSNKDAPGIPNMGNIANTDSGEMVKLCNEAVKDCEDIKITRVEQDKRCLIAYYVSVFGQEADSITKKLSEVLRGNIHVVRELYDFEDATRIVFGV